MIGNVFVESPWEISRCGKFTSSKIDCLLTEPPSKEAKAKGELSKSAKTYILGRAAEIITGTRRNVLTAAIEWGNNYEPEAAEKLKEIFPTMIYNGKENPRFFRYSDFSGGSPDGFDEKEKLVFEIKCPEDPANHVAYCLFKTGDDLKEAERDYYHQIQMNMICVGKELGIPFFNMKGIFASYCPIVNDPYIKLKVIVIDPDLEFATRLQAVLPKAEERLAAIVWEMNPQGLNGQPTMHGMKDNPIAKPEKV